MKETVTLNRKEQTRAKALALLGERRCTIREAAEPMGVSRRHLFRPKKAYREEGPGRVAPGKRGRAKKGVPTAWPGARHSIFRGNDKEPWTLSEELPRRREPPQVARALEEL